MTTAELHRGRHRATAAEGRSPAGVRVPSGARDGLLPAESGPRRALVRTVAVAAVLTTAGYLCWRIAATVPSGPAAWVGLPFLALEIYGAIALVLFVATTWDVRPARPDPAAQHRPRPTVTVLIPTYNEHLDVLLPTVAACLALTGEHETWVLDDGDRIEVEEMVTALGARYVRRPRHDHAKAGNLNHALRMVTTDLVAVFDADHVPDPRFLERTLPYFGDDRLALVQTPQHFYNTDSFEHLRPGGDLHEESLFYRVIQAGKHNTGSAFWCGTNAVLRVAALRDVGGVATESLTEDFHTTLKLHRAGWRSAYHNEVLARGLAAGSPDAFYAQRRRWGRGAMQVLRSDNPLTGSGLTFGQRLGYLYSLSAWFDSWRTLGMTLVPVAALVTGLFPVDAPPLQFAVVAGTAFVLQQLALALLARGFAPVGFSLLFEMVRLPSNLAATLSLFRRGTGRFAVTAKGRTGEVRTRARVPRLLVGLAVLLAAGVVHAVVALVGAGPAEPSRFGGMVVPLLWVLVSSGFVVAAIRRVRDPRFSAERREAHRFPVRMPATLDGAPAQLVDVSLGGGQVRVWGTTAPAGSDARLSITVPDRAEPVEFLVTVLSREGSAARVQFVGRQWQALAALSMTAFGAGATRMFPTASNGPRREVSAHRADPRSTAELVHH